MELETINELNRNTDMLESWLSAYWIMRQMACCLNTSISLQKSKWKCKHCKEKINEPIQIITQESHLPVYHIKCYMAIHDAIIHKFNNQKSIIENQIEIARVTVEQGTKE